jgi:hypothetical protein
MAQKKSRYPVGVAQALEMAGENRTQLEKTIYLCICVKYYAHMNLDYVIKVTPIIEVCPFSISTNYNTSRLFYVND